MQATLFDEVRTDPMTCPHGTDYPEVGRVLCTRNGGKVWTSCRASFCGEPPRCSYEEPDNSPEACARRLAWMAENGGKADADGS